MPNSHPWAVTSLCFAASMVEGYDLQSAGVAAPALAAALHVSKDNLGLVFACSTVGMLVGAAIGGWLSDRIGRKNVLVGSLAMFGVFSICTVSAFDLKSLLIMRVLTGVGLGSTFPSLIALVAAHAEDARRAGRVTMVSAGMPLGGAVAVLFSLTTAAGDWRWIFYLGGAGPLILALVVAIAMPSDRSSQRSEDRQAMESGRASTRRILFGDGRARATLSLWIASLCTLLVLYLMVNWLPSLLVSRGSDRSEALLASLGFNIAGTAGAVACGVLMGRARRTRTLVLTYAGAIVGTAALAMSGSLAATVASASIVGACITAGQFAIYGLSADCYPSRWQGTGAGAAVAFGRIGAVIGPLLAGVILAEGGSPTDVLVVLLPLISAALIALLFLSRPAGSPDSATEG